MTSLVKLYILESKKNSFYAGELKRFEVTCKNIGDGQLDWQILLAKQQLHTKVKVNAMAPINRLHTR